MDGAGGEGVEWGGGWGMGEGGVVKGEGSESTGALNKGKGGGGGGGGVIRGCSGWRVMGVAAAERDQLSVKRAAIQ